MYSFSYLEPVCCPTSSCNCCFLTCIQIFQEAGQVAWYSHLLKNFPQFALIHTLKGFGIVNKAEVDFFWNSCFFDDPTDVGNLISDSSAFSKPSFYLWKFWIHMLYSAYKLNKQGDNMQPYILLSQFETSPLFHIQF